MSRPGLWRRTDVAQLALMVAIGVILLAVSWWKTSGAASVPAQNAWVVAGGAGLLFSGVGTSGWLLAGRRAVGQRSRRLATVLARQRRARRRCRTALVEVDVVSAETMTRYHRPACRLVVGKSTTSSSPGAFQQQGLRPCGVCLPAEAGTQ
jgi:hypothetical protein